MLKRLIHLLFSTLLCLPGFSQYANYQSFENITLGPEASVISSFAQDNQGLMWIGSDKGLFSYDGYAAQPHFTYGQHSNTRIHCGAAIGDRHLYLGSDNGLLIYNYHTDTYEETDADFPTDIRAMVIQDDVLWIGTLNGLFTYRLSTGELHKKDRDAYPGLPHETIYSIILAKDNTIYVGTYNGLCSYSASSDTFTPIPLLAYTQKSNQFVNSLLEDKERECIWIGTEGNLFRYAPDTHTVTQIKAFYDNSVKSLALDKNQNLLAGTDNGLYVYNETKPLQHITHDSRNILSLSNNIIWSIFTDKESNIWLGTDYGISFSRFNSDYQYIPISQITGTGEGNHFYSLCKDSRGFFWFGGTNGLIRFNGISNQSPSSIWYKMGNKQYPLLHNRIRHVYEDKEQQLWIATDGSLNRYDYRTNQFIHYNIVDSTGRNNTNWAYHLFEDERGYLWIATCLGGIFVVDKHKLMQSRDGNYVAEYNYTTENGLSGMFVNRLVPDHEGNVWVLLYNNSGINKINIHTREISRVFIESTLESESLNYLLCDNEGVIWGGFRGGVMRFGPRAAQPDIISLGSFSRSEILSMCEIEQDIWVTTSDGVWVVHKETMEAKRLHTMDNAFTSLFYDRDHNNIYMGSVDGFVITTPQIVESSTINRPIVITALYVNDQLVTPESGITDQSIRYAQTLHLTHTQNNLSVEVSDYPYAMDEKNKFVYRLSHVDQDWNLLNSHTNRITYNNLNYGKYQLTISKLSADGHPSDNRYTLQVLISPPWYYTGWAKAIYILLGISLVLWTINFFRVKSRLKYERLEKEKLREQSRAKIDFFTHISHDLKTPLSMIIAPVSQLLLSIKDPSEKKQLETVQRNAMKLNSLIHQVLDFNRVDNNAGSFLILSKVELVSFAHNLFAVFEEGAVKEKQLTFLFESDLPNVYMDIDVIKFESVLTNLLSNAFKYTPEEGEIALSIRHNKEANKLEINVSDTGMGIPKQDIPYVFQRFFQSPATQGKKEGTGIGLYLVKTYTELHGGSIRIASQENQGTSITLSLPFPAQEAELVPQQTAGTEHNTSTTQPLILVVEDNPEIAGFISDILRPHYRCQIAENGKLGVEYCMELLPDLIISDIMMPVMDGLEMCRHIKKNIPTSTIPIILLTAKNDKETELESIQLNIDAFIAKPFEPEILLSRITQLLKNKQQLETQVRIEALATPKAIEAVSHDEKFLSRITQIIEDHVSDSDLNVNALCELSGINNKQIYRKIKQLTGMSPVEYIKSIRMKKAAMLLGQKKFSVAEVMYMVGFSNHSYFSKCFQAEFGKTPRGFMEEDI